MDRGVIEDGKIISDNLKFYMELKEMSIAQLAKEIHATDRAVEYWVKGLRMPKAPYLVRIAKALDVPLEKLLEGVDE